MFNDKPCDGSFIKMSSAAVTDLANAALSEIERRKKNSKKNLIIKKRQEILKARELKKNTLWCRIFGYKELPVPTDEEIISGDVYDMFSPIPSIRLADFIYFRPANTAHRLLNAAKYAEEIYVSTQDLESLSL